MGIYPHKVRLAPSSERFILATPALIWLGVERALLFSFCPLPSLRDIYFVVLPH